MAKLISEGTIELDRGVSVYSCAAAVGKMESDGPLGNCFDYAAEGAELGLTTWEKAESTFQQYAFDIALRKGKLIKEDISFIFAGDLLNQCTGSAYGLRDTDISFIGLYGACSTMAESLAMASLFCGYEARRIFCRRYLLTLLLCRKAVQISHKLRRRSSPYCSVDSYRRRLLYNLGR